MKRIGYLALVFLAAFAARASAASPRCTIHPKKGATREDLAAMARVTQSDAQKIALASFKRPLKATVKDAELEAEYGCLIYSFDIAVAGQKGVQEVQVDAGSGKILSSKHETPKAEAAEKAKDNAKAKS